MRDKTLFEMCIGHPYLTFALTDLADSRTVVVLNVEYHSIVYTLLEFTAWMFISTPRYEVLLPWCLVNTT